MFSSGLSRALLAICIVTAPMSSALAQEEEEDAQYREARARFDVAEAEFARGHYALAADQFGEVYRMLEGHPRQYLVLYNIARCYEESGLHAQAADAFERYLAEAGTSSRTRRRCARGSRSRDVARI